MTLEWLAHSCFCLTNDQGSQLLIDPYRGEDVGYKEPKLEKVDVVICSHGHMDHANTAVVQNTDYTKIDKAGHFEAKDFIVDMVPTYHDNENGTKRGENLVSVIQTDGLRFCHCGDLGHVLNEEQIKALGKIDVLMIPVGGLFTIDAKQAAEVVEALDVKIVIPMHYKTDACIYDLAPVEDFLEEMRKNEYAISMYHDSVMQLDGYTIPKRAKVYVMESKY